MHIPDYYTTPPDVSVKHLKIQEQIDEQYAMRDVLESLDRDMTFEEEDQYDLINKTIRELERSLYD
jgi:hypothetical protein